MTKGKQGSPMRSPRKAAQEKATPAGGSSPRKQQAAQATGKQAAGKRKLVYRYGQNQQTSTAAAVSVLEAAKAVMKQNLAQTAGESKVTVRKQQQKSVAGKSAPEVVDSGPPEGAGKKVIKTIPGQPHIQEVHSENGEFLNFRCKLCKVRFTDLKEIHIRGRRHQLNLEELEKKTGVPAPVEKSEPKDDQPKVIKKKPKVEVVKAPVPVPVKKKVAPAIRKPAILDNLIHKSNIADVLNREKKKENYTIYQLYKEMRESCVISDRWCIPEPMWDPCTNREVLLVYENDVLMDGTARMKRCLKVLDDFELIVLLDGVDKSHIFKEKHPTVKSLQEMLDLIRKVTMVKVCNGVKDCDPSELENISTKVLEKGGSWYSAECNVEVERGCLGNICKKCTSLRNTLRRRMRRQYGGDPSNPTPNRNLLSNTMKPVLRTVGEALYLNLQHMSGINRISPEDSEGPPPPRSETQILHPDLGIYMNQELKERLDDVAANPPPLTKLEHILEFDGRTITKTLKRIPAPLPPTTFRGTIAGQRALGIGASKRLKTDGFTAGNSGFVLGNNGELTLVQTQNGETIQLPEGYVLADDNQQTWGDGNIVIQKVSEGQDSQEQFILGDDNNLVQVGGGGLGAGSNFTLEDGEEYEVIGEAPAGVDNDALQVLPIGNNSDIEIIEVDENMIQLVDDNSQPEIQPVEANSDIFKFLQAQARI